MFAVTSDRVNEQYILRRVDVVFFKGSAQLDWSMWEFATRMEVRFRASKCDQMRKGAVLTRSRTGPPRKLSEGGGGAVDLMIELMSCSSMFLPPSAPLVAFGTGRGKWSMWSQAQATK